VFFPHFDLDHWRVVAEERCEADERHSSAYTFQTLERAS
jgi:dihydrofolate reductase